MDRYNYCFYKKRCENVTKITQSLIELIQSANATDLPFTIEQLNCLKYEDLTEIAIAAHNPDIKIILGNGKDFNNNRDSKFSIVRNHDSGQRYSASIKVKNKTNILSVVYEPIQSKFYYFAFPVLEGREEYQIPFERNTGVPCRNNEYWRYECKTFKQLATEGSTWFETRLIGNPPKSNNQTTLKPTANDVFYTLFD